MVIILELTSTYLNIMYMRTREDLRITITLQPYTLKLKACIRWVGREERRELQREEGEKAYFACFCQNTCSHLSNDAAPL